MFTTTNTGGAVLNFERHSWSSKLWQWCLPGKAFLRVCKLTKAIISVGEEMMLSYSKGTWNSLARKAYYVIEKESRVISTQEGRIRKSTSCSIVLLYKILPWPSQSISCDWWGNQKSFNILTNKQGLPFFLLLGYGTELSVNLACPSDTYLSPLGVPQVLSYST